MAGERWKKITVQQVRTATKDKPLLLSDGVSVWIGWYELNEDTLDSGVAGWTDGVAADWGYQLIREIEPSHWRSLPIPPKARKASPI